MPFKLTQEQKEFIIAQIRQHSCIHITKLKRSFDKKFGEKAKGPEFQKVLQEDLVDVSSIGFVKLKPHGHSIFKQGRLDMPQAIPFIQWSSDVGGRSDSELFVNQVAIDMIEEIKGPIGAVAWVGPERIGKSYGLSRWIKEKGDAVFTLGKSLKGCTKGIWVYNRPKEIIKDGKKISVLMLDTVGFGATDGKEAAHDVKILTMCSLLSSMIVYNAKGQFKREDEKLVSLVGNVREKLQLTNNQQRDQIKLSLPNFMLLLRDFQHNSKVIHEGKSIDLVSFIQSAVFDKKDDQDKHIFFTAFKKVLDVETLPRPSSDPEVLRAVDKFDQDPTKVNPQFVKQLKSVLQKMEKEIQPKQTVKGESVTGKQFASMILQYIQMINDDSTIPVYNIWQSTVSHALNEKCDGLIKSYKAHMNKLQLPVPAQCLEEHHTKKMDEIEEEYDSHFSHYIPDSSATGLTQIKDRMMDKIFKFQGLKKSRGKNTSQQELKQATIGERCLYSGFQSKNYDCSVKIMLSKLLELEHDYFDAFQVTSDTTFEDIEKRFDKMENEFNGLKCNGYPHKELPGFEDAWDQYNAQIKSNKKKYEKLIGQFSDEKKKQVEQALEKERLEQERRKKEEEQKRIAEEKRVLAEQFEKRMTHQQEQVQKTLTILKESHSSRLKEQQETMNKFVQNNLATAKDHFQREIKMMQHQSDMQQKNFQNQVQFLTTQISNAKAQAAAARAAAAAAAAGCFSTQSIVHTPAGSKMIEDVAPGEKILTSTKSGKLMYSSVYFADSSHQKVEMNQIYVQNLSAPLEITDYHLVVRVSSKGKKAYVMSKDIEEGDLLLVNINNSMQECQVTQIIRKVLRPWCYILTKQDTVLVSGILCSCFEYEHFSQKLDNLDLRVLYAIGGSRLTKNRVLTKLNGMWDDFTEACMRRAIKIRGR